MKSLAQVADELDAVLSASTAFVRVPHPTPPPPDSHLWIRSDDDGCVLGVGLERMDRGFILGGAVMRWADFETNEPLRFALPELEGLPWGLEAFTRDGRAFTIHRSAEQAWVPVWDPAPVDEPDEEPGVFLEATQDEVDAINRELQEHGFEDSDRGHYFSRHDPTLMGDVIAACQVAVRELTGRHAT